VIELTPNAVERLQSLRAGELATSYVRVYVAGKSCCGYRYGLAFDDATGPADTIVEAGGIPLAIDEQSKPYLEGATVDFVDALTGGGFMVMNPSLDRGGCACGRR